MDQAAIYMNDAAKSTYPYATQIPYLNGALQELQEFFELNDVPVTSTVSAVMTCPAGTTSITFTVVGSLVLPSDLIEPSVLWERTKNVNPYIPMTKVDFLPRYMEGTQISQFQYYTWQNQSLNFLATNQDNDIKMDYIKNLFVPIVASTDAIAIINSSSYLQFRTAALLAEFVAENPTRAQELNSAAALAMDRVIGIGTKGRQSIMTRHRAFRAGYKRRSNM